jgi:hypothetical protein
MFALASIGGVGFRRVVRVNARGASGAAAASMTNQREVVGKQRTIALS